MSIQVRLGERVERALDSRVGGVAPASMSMQCTFFTMKDLIGSHILESEEMEIFFSHNNFIVVDKSGSVDLCSYPFRSERLPVQLKWDLGWRVRRKGLERESQ